MPLAVRLISSPLTGVLLAMVVAFAAATARPSAASHSRPSVCLLQSEVSVVRRGAAAVQAAGRSGAFLGHGGGAVSGDPADGETAPPAEASETTGAPQATVEDQTAESMSVLDANGDGIVEKEEVLKFAEDQGLPAEQMEEEFKALDANGDGSLDSNEIGKTVSDEIAASTEKPASDAASTEAPTSDASTEAPTTTEASTEAPTTTEAASTEAPTTEASTTDGGDAGGGGFFDGLFGGGNSSNATTVEEGGAESNNDAEAEGESATPKKNGTESSGQDPTTVEDLGIDQSIAPAINVSRGETGALTARAMAQTVQDALRKKTEAEQSAIVLEKQASQLKAKATALLNRAQTAAQEAAVKAARKAAQQILRMHLEAEAKAQRAFKKAAQLRAEAKEELQKAYNAALTTAKAMKSINQAYSQSQAATPA